MVDVVDSADASVQSDVVGNERIDIVNCEVSGHKVFLTLSHCSLESGSNVCLALSLDLLDDLSQDACSNLLVNACSCKIELLELSLCDAVCDESLSVNSAVADDLERYIFELILICCANKLSGEDLNGHNAGIFDLGCDLFCDNGVLLADELTVFGNYVVSCLASDDSCGKLELLVDLVDTYSLEVVS